MAAAAAVTINISGSNLLGGFTEILNQVINLANPLGTVFQIVVTNTPFQIAPSGTTYVLIVPPPLNSVPLFLGGNVFASMGTINAGLPTLVAVPAASTLFIACAAGQSVPNVAIGYF